MKRLLQFIFFIIFVYYQTGSILSFLAGEVVYDLIQESGDALPFPGVTLCPYQLNRMFHVKDQEVRKRYNLSLKDMEDYKGRFKKMIGKSMEFSIIYPTPVGEYFLSKIIFWLYAFLGHFKS